MVFGIDTSGFFFIIGLVAYLLIFMHLNNIFIAAPNCRWAEAHIGSVRKRIEIEQEAPEHENPREKKIRVVNDNLLDDAQKFLNESKHNLYCWSGSLELAAWNKIHEAERHAVWIMPYATVSARLKRAMGELNELQKEKKEAWQTTIKDIQNKNVKPDDARAILNQFLADLYDARDSRLALLVNLKNKVMWFALIGILLIAGFGLSGYSLVLLAGMVGGFLSRMQRVLMSKEVPIDYGEYWAPLFLSPIAGGLAALAGLFIVLVLQDLKVLNLDIIKDSVLKEPNPHVLGVAVLFGISERLLSSVVKQAENKFLEEKKNKES